MSSPTSQTSSEELEYEAYDENISAEDLAEELEPFGFTLCAADQVSAAGTTQRQSLLSGLWKDYWGKNLRIKDGWQNAWPEWKEALTGAQPNKTLLDEARRFKLLPGGLPSAPSLNLSKAGFKQLKSTAGRIVECEEYKEMYSDMNQVANMNGAVVTGERGCGVTYYMLYCLVRKLSEKKPVFLSSKDDLFFLFTGHSVWKSRSFLEYLDSDNVVALSTAIPSQTWMLLDGDGRPPGLDIAQELRVGHYFVPVLFARVDSGQYNRWFSEVSLPSLFVLNPPNYQQIFANCSVLSSKSLGRELDVTGSSLRDLLDCMDKFGPSQKACMDHFFWGYRTLAARLDNAVQLLSIDKLESVFAAIELSEQSSPDYRDVDVYDLNVQDQVALLTRVTPRAYGRQLSFEVPSNYVFNRLLEAFSVYRKNEVEQFVDMYLQHSATGTLSSYFFQRVSHLLLSNASDYWKERCSLVQVYPGDKAEHKANNPNEIGIEDIFQQRVLHFYRGDHPPAFDQFKYAVPENMKRIDSSFDAVTYAVHSPPTSSGVPTAVASASRLPNSSKMDYPSAQGKGRTPSVSMQVPRHMSPGSNYGAHGCDAESNFSPSLPDTASIHPHSELPSSYAASPPPSALSFPTSPYSTMHLDAASPQRGPDAQSGTHTLKRSRAGSSNFEGKRPEKRQEIAKHFIALQIGEGLKGLRLTNPGFCFLDEISEGGSDRHFVYVTFESAALDVDKFRAKVNEKLPEGRATRFLWYLLNIDLSGM